MTEKFQHDEFTGILDVVFDPEQCDEAYADDYHGFDAPFEPAHTRNAAEVAVNGLRAIEEALGCLDGSSSSNWD